jgi:hypothetical protein
MSAGRTILGRNIKTVRTSLARNISTGRTISGRSIKTVRTS